MRKMRMEKEVQACFIRIRFVSVNIVPYTLVGVSASTILRVIAVECTSGGAAF